MKTHKWICVAMLGSLVAIGLFNELEYNQQLQLWNIETKDQMKELEPKLLQCLHHIQQIKQYECRNDLMLSFFNDSLSKKPKRF